MHAKFWWGYLKETAVHIWEADIKIHLRYSWRARNVFNGIRLETNGVGF